MDGLPILHMFCGGWFGITSADSFVSMLRGLVSTNFVQIIKKRLEYRINPCLLLKRFGNTKNNNSDNNRELIKGVLISQLN
jgi:hypothetical protein